MDNGLKVRQIIFENLLGEGENRKNWEKLCASNRPLVPFVGAGISAWCYPTWNNLLRIIVEKVYSHQCAEIVQEALECEEKPNVENRDAFHWMEEIAECIFETHSEAYQKYIKQYSLKESKLKGADLVLHNLRNYVGEEAKNKKVDAVKELYEAFSEEKLKGSAKIPEYQNLFSRLFQDVLVTTNYDKALESCYSSILSYSYMDLNRGDEGDINWQPHSKYVPQKDSWLVQAVMGKLDKRQHELDRKENFRLNVTFPGMPMLLKVHGSIERANDIALSWSGYEKAYAGEMPQLFRKIVRKSTMVFLGCGIRDDRILAQLKDVKDGELFAFLPKMKDENDDAEQKKLLKEYKICPIYYDKELLEQGMPDGEHERDGYHEFFLGLLLENLARRKKYYPKVTEELWDEERYPEDRQEMAVPDGDGKKVQDIMTIQRGQITKLHELSRSRWLQEGEPQYVHKEQALQIWDMVNNSMGCPLIAIIGAVGTGKTSLCKSIQELHKSYRDTIQFFYISLSDCKSWEEFWIRLCEGLNIMPIDMQGKEKWRELAGRVTERCGVYWKSVLILDHLEDPQNASGALWETIKEVLQYWKENRTRVIIVCQSYPENLLCYTWQIKHLEKDEAWRVFYSACNSVRNKRISAQEQEAARALFDKEVFQAAEVNLLGRYADSKSNMSCLREEWDFYYKPGDKIGQTLARILWNNLLAEHCFEDKDKDEQRNIIKNILWIWGILGKYPGNVPYEFIECATKDSAMEKELSKKTIMYMKNFGLCEEVADEQQQNILNNIIACVEKNFVNLVDADIKEIFLKFKNQFDSQGDGLVWFRGCFMQAYEKKLREYIIGELPENTEELDPVQNILALLDKIGTCVENSEERTGNTKLNVILHNEIKTIVRFLYACLMEEGNEQQVVEISSKFYTYYHYIPDYAEPFVTRVLEIMDKNTDIPEMDISMANMNKVMGDIQRLLGKKEKAVQSYKKATAICDKLILSQYSKKEDDGEKGKFYRGLHIKAGILIASNYYENSEKLSEEAEKIYRSMDDKPGLAYFYQRTAETKLEEYGTKRTKNTETDGKDNGKFEELKHYFLNALELYRQVEDKTRIAYMLKSIGDLIVEFGECIERGGSRVAYNIDCPKLDIVQGGENSQEDGTEATWFHAAADFYMHSFVEYCRHINWRGFPMFFRQWPHA